MVTIREDMQVGLGVYDVDNFTRDLKRADDAVAQYASGTQSATDRVQSRLDAVARKTKTVADQINANLRVATEFNYNARASDISAYGKTLDGLKAKYDPLAAAAEKYKVAVTEVTVAQKMGILTQDQATAAIQRTNAAYAQESIALQSAQNGLDVMRAKINPYVAARNSYLTQQKLINEALKIGAVNEMEAAQAMERAKSSFSGQLTSLRSTGQALNAGGKSWRNFGAIIQNAGYQVGDFAVQVASGQGVIRPFIQQGTQMVSFFGAWGAAVGAALAVAGAFYAALADTGDATDHLADASKKAADAQDLLQQVMGDSIKSTMDNRAQALLAAQSAEAQARSEIHLAESILARRQAELAATQTALPFDVTGAGADMANRQRSQIDEQMAIIADAQARVEDLKIGISEVLATPTQEAAQAADKVRSVTDALRENITQIGQSAREQAIYNQLKAAGVDADSAAGREIAALAGREYDLQAARKMGEKASQDALTAEKNLQAARGAASKYIDDIARENRELQLQIDGHKELVPALQDEVRLREQLQKAGLSQEEQASYLGQLKAVTDQQRELNETLDAQQQLQKETEKAAEDARREAEKAIEDQTRAANQRVDDIVQYGGDAFADMFAENSRGWAGMWDNMKQTALQTLARITADFALRPIVVSIVAATTGMALSQDGTSIVSSAAASGSGGGVSGLGSLTSVGKGLLNNGLYSNTLAGYGSSLATSSLGQSLGLGYTTAKTGLHLTAAGESLSGAFGNLGYGAIGGIAGSLLGLGTGNQWANAGLSTAGSLAGSMAGTGIAGALGMGAAAGSWAGPVGAAAGALAALAAGSLFGAKKSVGPAMGLSLDASGGLSMVSTDNGADKDDAQSFGDSVSATAKLLLAATGGTFQNAGLVQTARNGYEVYTDGGRTNTGDDLVAAIKALSAGGIKGGDSDILSLLQRSDATSVEQLVSDAQLAKWIKDAEAAKAAVAAGQENYSAITDQIKAITDAYADQITRAKQLGLATTTLTEARDAEYDALVASTQAVMDQASATASQFFDSQLSPLTQFQDSLMTGSGSTLSAVDQYGYAKKAFSDLSANADMYSSDQIASIGQQYLQAARAYGASGSVYQDAFKEVNAVLGDRIDYLNSQQDIAVKDLGATFTRSIQDQTQDVMSGLKDVSDQLAVLVKLTKAAKA